MKPVVIDFLPVSPPPRGWRWAVCLFGAMLILGSGLLAWRVWQWQHWEQQGNALQAQINVQQAQNIRPDVMAEPSRPAAGLPPYVDDAWLAWRESQWLTAAALNSMEHVSILGVQPVSIELDARAGTVEVQLEFKSREALFAYLSALNSASQEPSSPASSSPAGTSNGAHSRQPWRLLQAKPVTPESPVGTAAVVFTALGVTPSAR